LVPDLWSASPLHVTHPLPSTHLLSFFIPSMFAVAFNELLLQAGQPPLLRCSLPFAVGYSCSLPKAQMPSWSRPIMSGSKSVLHHAHLFACRPLMSCCCCKEEAARCMLVPWETTPGTWSHTLRSWGRPPSPLATTLPPGCWRTPQPLLKRNKTSALRSSS